MFIGWYCSKDYVLIQSLRENAKIRPNKGKTTDLKSGIQKKEHESKIARNFMQHFVQKTGMITNMIALV